MGSPLLVRVYAEHEEHDRACVIYGKELASPAFLDQRLERSITYAALRVALLGVSSSDLAKSFTIIRSCAAEKNLAGARRCSSLLGRVQPG